MKDRKQMAKAIRWAVGKLSGTLTDKKIAEKYGLSVERIKKARQRMGIKKAGHRHKVKAETSTR